MSICLSVCMQRFPTIPAPALSEQQQSLVGLAGGCREVALFLEVGRYFRGLGPVVVPNSAGGLAMAGHPDGPEYPLVSLWGFEGPAKVSLRDFELVKVGGCVGGWVGGWVGGRQLEVRPERRPQGGAHAERPSPWVCILFIRRPQVIGQGSFGRVFLVRLIGGSGVLPSACAATAGGDAGAGEAAPQEDEGYGGLKEADMIYAMKVLRKVDVARRQQVRRQKRGRAESSSCPLP